MAEDVLAKSRRLIAQAQDEQLKEKILEVLPQGHGSGLDADLLDGLHAAEILAKMRVSGGGRGGGVTDHGALTGLEDNDHPQYMRMKTGTYTGNGAATKAVTGIGFKPKTLMIYMQTNGNKDCGITAEADNVGGYQFTKYSDYGVGQTLWEIDHIRSLDADGFTVGDGTGSSNVFNMEAVNYTYIAFG